MAEIRVYIQPRLPAASSQTAFYDFSKHVEFDSLEWEQNDQGNASTMRANIYSIMPVSTTNWASYTGATEAIQIQNAIDDQFYHLDIPSRTEIQIRDVSTSPHTILWGGVVTRVSENRDGGAIVGSIDAVDYTALLDEAVALEFTPLANSTIKQTITSGTYTFTPSFAERTAGLAAITVSSISVGAPYSRTLEIGDTIVVNISDDTYDGVHKITGIASEGSTYKLRFQQYSNVADSVSAAVTGAVSVPGFMTTANAPQLDSRVSTVAGNITDLNPDWRWSPRNPDITRAISNATRTTTTATITTSAPHGFGLDGVVTITLTNGPSGFADLNGSFVIASTPTDTTFTYTTITSGTITSGAATGTAACAGEITPTPMKGGTLSRNLQYAVERGNGVFYLGAGTLDGGGNLTIPLNVKSKALSDLITNGLFEANRTVSVSKITSPASTAKTVTTAYPHGLYTGYSVTVSGATGTNAANVNGNTYTITVTSSTTFTFTAATSNALNLTGGSIAITAASGWSVGSYSVDTTGATGPYGVGNSAYYVGSDHQDAELASTNRIAVTAGEKYFFSWRTKAGQYNKAHLHVKFYNAGGTFVGNSHGYDICKVDSPNNEWSRNYGLIEVPATATQMTPVLHHDSFASSYSVYYTDIQAIKLTGAFGFSDRVAEDETYYNGLTSGSIDLRDFENPSAPEESGEASNRIYVYAPYTVEDPLTGARQVTAYRNTYDFVQGVWSAGGKRIEASIVELDATDETTAMLTAQQYFKERGISLRSFEFEHISGPLNVGDVIPFIWNELGIAEALVVRKQVGYLIGQEVFYRVQLGGDMSFQRSTMYLVERRLKEITGDAAYFSPPPSPYPGYPTEGGIVTPASPSGVAGSQKIDISWEYPQSVLSGASFGGFVVLRSEDAGDNWKKASTGEAILTAQNPLAPDTAVPSFTDTTVTASTGYIYKVAAVDVSGAAPVLTEYSAETTTLTPTAPGGADFTQAYSGLGINVPKVVDSVTPSGNPVPKTISTIISGASTTATVTTATAHGFSTGNVVGITGATPAPNNADVNGAFYIITVTSATQFTITKTGTNILSLAGGTATGYTVSGAFVDNTATNRVLGDAFSLVQFPVGQIVYSEADGKLYRNGKHPSPGTGAAWDNYWTRASVDAIDVTSDGSIVISADKITTGTLNAANVAVTNLNADNITSGTINAGVIAVTNLDADEITTGTISADLISGGTINASVIAVTNLDADEITTGSLTLDGSQGVAITSENFSVSASGIVNTKTISVTDSTVGPGILSSKSAAVGDFAVPSADTIQMGHWTAGSTAAATITGVALNTPSVGYTRYTANNSFVAGSQIDITGCNPATLDLLGGVISSRTSTTFTVKIAMTDAYISGGTAVSSTSVGTFTTDLSINSSGLFTIGKSSLGSGNVHTVNGTLNADGLQINGVAVGGGSSATSLEIYESDGGGTSRGRIRGSDTVAGRIVVENTAGSGNVILYVDGDVTTVNGGQLNVDGVASALAFTGTTSVTAFNASGGGNIVLTGADDTVPITGNGEIKAIPNTTTLTTNSARWVSAGAGVYNLRRDSSTRRVKTNIVDADDAVLVAAKNLRAVHYEALEKNEQGEVVPSGRHTLGLVAEEILEAGLDCAVTYDEGGIPDGYDERVIIAALLHRVNDLEARLAELEG